MSCGIIQIRMNAVKPITVVPFFHRLRRLEMALIKSHIVWRVEAKRPRAPPCSKLHLIMGIGAPRIEDNSLARFHVNSDILLPQIAMYQCWRDLTAVRLQSPQESRYGYIDKLLASSVIFWPRTICLIVVFDNIFQLMGERSRPALFPGYCTFHNATYRGNGKSKHSVRRRSFPMKLSYLRRKVDWLRSCRKIHIVEVSKEEIYLRFTVMVHSPCCWLRHQFWNQSIDG